jgi:hypothetical protein
MATHLLQVRLDLNVLQPLLQELQQRAGWHFRVRHHRPGHQGLVRKGEGGVREPCAIASAAAIPPRRDGEVTRQAADGHSPDSSRYLYTSTFTSSLEIDMAAAGCRAARDLDRRTFPACQRPTNRLMSLRHRAALLTAAARAP